MMGGAALGDVAVSLFVAGATFGWIFWCVIFHGRRNVW